MGEEEVSVRVSVWEHASSGWVLLIQWLGHQTGMCRVLGAVLGLVCWYLYIFLRNLPYTSPCAKGSGETLAMEHGFFGG